MENSSKPGSAAKDKLLFAHTDPGTIAGRYMRMFWHPVFRSPDLRAGRTAPLRIMGQDFTLYRGESGTAHLIDPRCAHRGSRLSVGWVEEDCVRCFYHGWVYDENGQCVEQPAEDSRSAAKVKIGGYPVHETMGLIFAYLGEGDPPAFPSYPDFEDWQGISFSASEHWRFNYFQHVENSVDTIHAAFVHRGSHDYNAEIVTQFPEKSKAGMTMTTRQSGDVTFIEQFGMPNSLRIDFPLPPDDDLGVLAWWVPVDDHSHRIFLVMRFPKRIDDFSKMPAWNMGPLDPHELADKVLAGELYHQDVDLAETRDIFFQDILAQQSQGIIANREHERLGRSDIGVIMLRQLWSAELRKVDEGREITRWASPAEGPVLYYKPHTEAEVKEILDASPLKLDAPIEAASASA